MRSFPRTFSLGNYALLSVVASHTDESKLLFRCADEGKEKKKKSERWGEATKLAE